MLPHQGAGAGQGLEDALILATLLSNPALTKDTIGLVSGVYETLRLVRASKTQDTSRESGDIYELRSYTYTNFEDVGEHLAHRFDWLWQHPLEEDVKRAKQLLSQHLGTVSVAV